MEKLHGTTTVKAGNPFSIPAEDFIISPLQTGTSLYIDSICNGVEDSKVVAEITPNEYTKVHGAVPYTVFHIDTTDDKYYIKW